MQQNKGLLVALIGISGVVLITGFMYIGYNNSEVRLRNQLIAQQRKNEAVFDNTWKIIQQQAGVTTQHKDAFKEIYGTMMDARYAKSGQETMRWIQEHNPQFDSSLFSKLMTSIEAQRTIFTREQTKLLDMKREHDNLLQTLPASFFVGSRAPIAVVIVTSGRTNQSFETGEDNDVDLFKKP